MLAPQCCHCPASVGQSPQLQSRHSWCPWRSRQCFVVIAVKCMAGDKEEELGRSIPRHKVHTVCLRQVITIQTQTSTMPGHWSCQFSLPGVKQHTPRPNLAREGIFHSRMQVGERRVCSNPLLSLPSPITKAAQEGACLVRLQEGAEQKPPRKERSLEGTRDPGQPQGQPAARFPEEPP